MDFLRGSSVLVTGGTGSFGQSMVAHLLAKTETRRVIVFSRDELKQYRMQHDRRYNDSRIRFFLGDVRDQERMARAFDGVDYVVHAAALKQVSAAEYNPSEAIKTNVLGAHNVIECAINKGIKRVVALSSDKAANPINLYGATKLCADKLFVAGNSYSGDRETCFAVVRYGNVLGSRGSVVPFFLRKRKAGVLPITDERMTRFWITLEQGVEFVLNTLVEMDGGEIFIPKLPSMKITDVARVIGPDCRLEYVGVREGEKLHEVLIPEDNAGATIEFHDRYVIPPQFTLVRQKDWGATGKGCPDGFRYASDTNDHWLTEEGLLRMIAELDQIEAREFTEERAHL